MERLRKCPLRAAVEAEVLPINRYIRQSSSEQYIMHELSIATNLVEVASEAAAKAGAERVSAVYLRLGTLSGVVRDALEFAFEVATDSTMLEGADLDIEEVPVVVFCPQCRAEKSLPERHPMFRAACPDCSTPTPEIRQGRELEIKALEVH